MFELQIKRGQEEERGQRGRQGRHSREEDREGKRGEEPAGAASQTEAKLPLSLCLCR